MRAAVLNVSATRRKRVTVNNALSLSSATTFEDRGTCKAHFFVNKELRIGHASVYHNAVTDIARANLMWTVDEQQAIAQRIAVLGNLVTCNVQGSNEDGR